MLMRVRDPILMSLRSSAGLYEPTIGRGVSNTSVASSGSSNGVVKVRKSVSVGTPAVVTTL